MKVRIGPYRDYWTTQKAEEAWIKFHHGKYTWEMKEEDFTKLDVAVEKLLLGWYYIFCKPVNFIRGKLPRRISIRIDNYDTWNADHTIALITLPLLKQLQATKHGAPHVDDEDVPVYLRSTAAAPKENEWDTDDFWHKRWDWVMDELIWTFQQLAHCNDGEDEFYHEEETIVEKDESEKNDFLLRMGRIRIDEDGLRAYHERINNGLRLFGKYYRGLWD